MATSKAKARAALAQQQQQQQQRADLNQDAVDVTGNDDHEIDDAESDSSEALLTREERARIREEAKREAIEAYKRRVLKRCEAELDVGAETTRAPDLELGAGAETARVSVPSVPPNPPAARPRAGLDLPDKFTADKFNGTQRPGEHDGEYSHGQK